jgi:hypothetical protein
MGDALFFYSAHSSRCVITGFHPALLVFDLFRIANSIRCVITGFTSIRPLQGRRMVVVALSPGFTRCY